MFRPKTRYVALPSPRAGVGEEIDRLKCPKCDASLEPPRLTASLGVCYRCGYHFRLRAPERIAMLVEPGSFHEEDQQITATDALGFKDSQPYAKRIEQSRASTGVNEAVTWGEASLAGHPLVIVCLDFAFMGGSMGAATGEKITNGIERALHSRLPLLVISASGGARMQEGMLSLMQMAKTAAALGRLGAAGVPYVSLLTDPTMGGVTASFASLADAAWEQVEPARHPARPYALDYIHAIFGNFFELHGDRLFGDDHAIIGGPAALDHRTVMVIAQQKGRTTAERAMRNFGMANPEGYRKALRLIRQAERFQFPIVAFVDTSGAFPGAGSEERGIAWAIADNLVALAEARVPIVTLVIGEGGSGGALGIGVGGRLLMMEHSIYSVAMPEACASLLWRDIARKIEAAEAPKLTAADLKRMGLADEIVPEPSGGAHNDYGMAAGAAGGPLRRHLATLEAGGPDSLAGEGYQRDP